MHIHFFTFIILAVISSLVSIMLDRRFVRNRRSAPQETPSTQQQPLEV